MDQKQTEGVVMKRGVLDPTTTITLTLTQITLTQTDKGGMTLWPRQLGPSTSPMVFLLRFSPPLLARLTPPHPESPESSESAHLRMCLLWRFMTSGLGPSRSPRRPATTNMETNTETEKGSETENAIETENVIETGSVNGRETGRGRATGFLRGA